MAIDDNASYELTGYQVKDLAGRIRLKADASAIPTVNDATLTLVQNGTTVGTFTANQSTNTTINLAGGVYADDPTSQANPDAWITSSDIDWSSIMTVLYDGGTTGTTGNITFSESAANFAKIKVYYKTSDNIYSSREYYAPDGKTISMTEMNMTSGNGWLKTAVYTVSGTTMNHSGVSGQITLPNSTATGDSYIVIMRVEGWKI